MASHINNLPNEILLEIFSYLPVPNLVLTVSEVCVKWRSLVKDPILWKNLTLVCESDERTREIINIIPQAPLLRAFHISNQPAKNAHKIVEAVSEHCRDLRTLLLKSIWERRVVFDSMMITTTPKQIAVLFRKFKNLRNLILPDLQSVHGNHLQAVAECCVFLEELDVSLCSNLNDDDLLYFIEKRQDTLVRLKLWGAQLTFKFFSKLHICCKLDTLGILCSTTMTSDSLWCIGNLQLKCLWLRISDFKPADLCKFFNEGNMSHLKELDFTHSSTIDDQVAKCISINCHSLQNLRINWCENVTDLGVINILACCKHLQKLCVVHAASLKGDFLHCIPALGKSLRYLWMDKLLEENLPADRKGFEDIEIKLHFY